MAFEIANLYATLSVKGGPLEAGLSSMQSKLQKFSVSMEKVSRQAKFMLVAIGGVLALTVKYASEAEESHSKFLAVFKEEADAAKAWGDAHAEAVGRAKMDMERYLSSMQDTFVPLGFARKQARELSQQIVKLSIDLASFNNTSDDTALRDMQSAIVGNHETVRKYGIILTEASLQQELWSMGIRKSADDITSMDKVLARLSIITKGSTDAIGDAERTSGSFANQLKRLQGELKDAASIIGNTFIPVLTEMMQKLTPIIEDTAAWAGKNSDGTLKLVGYTGAILGLLAVLPTLSRSLGLIAAHPVYAAFAAGVALMIGQIIALKLELAGLDADAVAPLAIGPSQRLPEDYDKLLRIVRADKARLEKELDRSGVGGWLKNKAEGLGEAWGWRTERQGQYTEYAGAIAQEKALMAARDLAEKIAEATAETGDQLDGNVKTQKEITEELKKQEALQRQKEWAQDYQDKQAWDAIIKKAEEIAAQDKKKMSEAKAAIQAGQQRGSAFTGVGGLSKRLQEAVYSKEQADATKKLIKSLEDAAKEHAASNAKLTDAVIANTAEIRNSGTGLSVGA